MLAIYFIIAILDNIKHVNIFLFFLRHHFLSFIVTYQ